MGSTTSRKPPTKPARLDVHVHPQTKKRLLAYSAAKGQSQGSIVDAALREYFDDAKQATLILRELGRVRNAVARLERNQDVLDAGVAGFVQMWLAYNPPLPEGLKAKAQAQAEQRFGQFIKFLREQLRQRKNFIAQMVEDDLLRNEDIRTLLDIETAEGHKG